MEHIRNYYLFVNPPPPPKKKGVGVGGEARFRA